MLRLRGATFLQNPAFVQHKAREKIIASFVCEKMEEAKVLKTAVSNGFHGWIAPRRGEGRGKRMPVLIYRSQPKNRCTREQVMPTRKALFSVVCRRFNVFLLILCEHIFISTPTFAVSCKCHCISEEFPCDLWGSVHNLFVPVFVS